MEELINLISTMNLNRSLAVFAVLGFGIFAMNKVFSHMKDGFGIFNVRITGIIIVATFVSILAVMSPSGESAAVGILGAIVGYLFGYGSKE